MSAIDRSFSDFQDTSFEQTKYVESYRATVAIFIKTDEFCITNAGFCITNDKFCI